MGRKPSGKPTGRPIKELDLKMFENLCAIQCTEEEIASVLEMCRDTLEDRVKEHYGEPFSTVRIKVGQGGKASLRRTQFNLARKNAAMAIWLGKQYLGQVDKQEQDIKLETNMEQVDEQIKILLAKYGTEGQA